MKLTITKSMSLLLGLFAAGLGIAMSIYANIGISAYDSFNTVLAQIFSIKVGTQVIICNSICVLIQLILLGRNFEVRRLWQLAMTTVLGFIINFCLYNLFANLQFSHYLFNLGFFLAGQAICASGIGLLLAVNWASFPLEPAVMVIADKFHWPFARARMMTDIFFILLALGLSLLFSLPIPIREGTIIGTIVYSPIMNFVFKQAKKYFLQAKPTLQG